MLKTDITFDLGTPRETLETGFHPDEMQSAAAPTCRLGFAFFLLVTATLLVRPSEIAPALEGWPIYEVLIVLSLCASIPVIVQQLRWSVLRTRPTTVCVLAMIPAIALSHLRHREIWEARMGVAAFLKVVVYYLLLVGLVNTPGRLRTFLTFVIACLLVVTGVCLLQYNGVIDLPTITACQQTYGVDDDTGDAGTLLRLQATGIFSDPNDFSLILVTALLLSWHHVKESSGLISRAAWLLPTIIFGYALALTRSRGGFLALIAAALYLLIRRFGWKRSLPVAALALPVILLAFGGRQTSIDLTDPDDTAQTRIQLWRDALEVFKTFPIFGKGRDTLEDEIGQVAHNSYIHCYAEMGVIGGTVFVGVFYVTFLKLRRVPEALDDEEVEGSFLRWKPTILAVVIAYGAGIFSLSRPYAIATYLILAIGTAYYSIAAAKLPSDGIVLDLHLGRRIGFVSLVTLFGLYVFVRVFAQ